MSVQHTAGPWEVHEVEGSVSVMPSPDNRYPDSFMGICTVYRFDHERPEETVQANARLIAAAPDLVAPAQDAVAILDVAIDLWNSVHPDEPDEVFTDLQRRFRAAIAKATAA